MRKVEVCQTGAQGKAIEYLCAKVVNEQSSGEDFYGDAYDKGWQRRKAP